MNVKDGATTEPLGDHVRRILFSARAHGPLPQEQDVLNLLKDYQAWHAAFGGAGEINLQAMGQFGPAGMIRKGAGFVGANLTRDRWRALARSYQHLEEALEWLKRDHFAFWMVLKKPYTGDPGDPSIVERWRKSENNNSIKWHDMAIALLCQYLKNTELFSVGTSHMSEEENRAVEDQYSEWVAVFGRLRTKGFNEDQAVAQLAEDFDVSEEDIRRVLEFRHQIERARCHHEGCTRTIFAQLYCQMHYRRKRRLKGYKG